MEKGRRASIGPIVVRPAASAILRIGYGFSYKKHGASSDVVIWRVPPPSGEGDRLNSQRFCQFCLPARQTQLRNLTEPVPGLTDPMP